MSANLLDGVKPEITQYGSMADGVLTSTASKDAWQDVARWPIAADTLAENQTLHIGISAKWHGTAATTGTAWAVVEYADAPGYTNSVNVKIDGIATEWQRFSLSAVVPSGMHMVDFHISAENLDAAYDATNPVLSYGSPVVLARAWHTTGRQEWLPKGRYWVQQPDSYDDTITLTCYDALSLLSATRYSDVATTYPATLETIIGDCCRRVGLVMDCQVPDSAMQYTVQTRPTTANLSAFQVCSYAAQCAGAFLRMDNATNHLVVGWYDLEAFEKEDWADGGTMATSTTPYSDGDKADGGSFTTTATPYSDGAKLDGGTFDTNSNLAVLGQFSSLTVGTDDVVVTGVQVKAQNEVKKTSDGKETNGADGETALAGKAGYVLDLGTNPLVLYGQASKVANQVYSRVGGMRFRRFSATTPMLDPSIEPGDPVSIEDRNGNVYRSYVTHVTLSVNGSMSLQCGAKTPARNSATGASAATQAIVDARNAIKREQTAREIAQKDLGEAISNKAGLYHTEERLSDGSTIHYLHDKPTIAASKVIWKMNSGAVAVSTDGGKTYATGLTAEGDELMNRIYAHGIDADYINAGTYTVKDSSGNAMLKIGSNVDGYMALLNPVDKKTWVSVQNSLFSHVTFEYLTNGDSGSSSESPWTDEVVPSKKTYTKMVEHVSKKVTFDTGASTRALVVLTLIGDYITSYIAPDSNAHIDNSISLTNISITVDQNGHQIDACNFGSKDVSWWKEDYNGNASYYLSMNINSRLQFSTVIDNIMKFHTCELQVSFVHYISTYTNSVASNRTVTATTRVGKKRGSNVLIVPLP